MSDLANVEFTDADAKRVSRLTDENNHTEALLEVSRVFDFKGAIIILDDIKSKHIALGYMTESLICDRNDMQRFILQVIERKRGKETHDEVKKCL